MSRCLLFFALLLAIGLLGAKGGAPAPPAAAAPQGRAALLAELRKLTPQFDAPPRIFCAVETKDGKSAQALFTAIRGGQRMRGFISVEGTEVRTTCDRAEKFSLASRPSARLRQVTFPDGTGTMQLPEGWRITSTRNGAVTAEGPDGGVDFGYAVQCYTPNAPNNTPFRPPCVAPYGDPARWLAGLPPQVLNNFQVLEKAPAPGWNQGVAQYLHFRGNYTGQPAEMFALVIEAPTSPYQFMVYYSQVRTPPDRFARMLPALMEVWKSWKTDDRVFRQRLDDAAKSMEAVGRIIREANANRRDAMDRSAIAWSNVIRGTWPVEDSQSGRRYAANQDYEPVLRTLNADAGYDRWRAVPYEELNRAR